MRKQGPEGTRRDRLAFLGHPWGSLGVLSELLGWPWGSIWRSLDVHSELLGWPWGSILGVMGYPWGRSAQNRCRRPPLPFTIALFEAILAASVSQQGAQIELKPVKNRFKILSIFCYIFDPFLKRFWTILGVVLGSWTLENECLA